MKKQNIFSIILITLFLFIGIRNLFSREDFCEATNHPYGGNIDALAINSNGHIFVGTGDLFFTGDRGKGVFCSTDNGDAWKEVNYGWTDKYILSLAFNSNDRLFAGTNGGGVFSSINPTTSVKATTVGIPTLFSLEHNYSNPFNSSTTIQFSIPKSIFVTIQVYNMLAEEVLTLVEEKLGGGKHYVKLNGSSLVSGVYYYRLQAGNLLKHGNSCC